LLVSFCNRAANYRVLLQKENYKDKATYASSPPCSSRSSAEVTFEKNYLLLFHPLSSNTYATDSTDTKKKMKMQMKYKYIYVHKNMQIYIHTCTCVLYVCTYICIFLPASLSSSIEYHAEIAFTKSCVFVTYILNSYMN